MYGGQPKTLWLCRCSCGRSVSVVSGSLKRGLSKSCGCYQQELTIQRFTVHGMSRSREHKAWSSMIDRTTNPRCKLYEKYHLLGIDPSFLDFVTFYRHIGPRPKGTSIDRIDNAKGYFPGNVRWANAFQQQRNTSKNRLITFREKTQPLSQWCEELGQSYGTILHRLKEGWPIHIALAAPIKPHTDSTNRRKHPESY
jgi:hypothetical protein